MLSLKLKDVSRDGKVFPVVTVQRRHMNGGKAGKTSSRTVELHPEVRAALSVWIEQMSKLLAPVTPDAPLFASRVHNEDGSLRPVSREQAWRLLVSAYRDNELVGKLGTHAMRKTFAGRMYDKLTHDLVKTQRALGHANINSTVQYLSFREEEISEAILGGVLVA